MSNNKEKYKLVRTETLSLHELLKRRSESKKKSYDVSEDEHEQNDVPPEDESMQRKVTYKMLETPENIEDDDTDDVSAINNIVQTISGYETTYNGQVNQFPIAEESMSKPKKIKTQSKLSQLGLSEYEIQNEYSAERSKIGELFRSGDIVEKGLSMLNKNHINYRPYEDSVTRSINVSFEKTYSFGIIAMRRDPNTSNLQFLAVQRRISIGLSELIRLKKENCKPDNLSRLVQDLTAMEQKFLLSLTFDALQNHAIVTKKRWQRQRKAKEYSNRLSFVDQKNFFFNSNPSMTIKSKKQKSSSRRNNDNKKSDKYYFGYGQMDLVDWYGNDNNFKLLENGKTEKPNWRSSSKDFDRNQSSSGSSRSVSGRKRRKRQQKNSQNKAASAKIFRKLQSAEGYEYGPNKYINFAELVEQYPTKKIEQTWGFPKGRQGSERENPLITALREFEEETGFSRNDLALLDTDICIEIFRGLNNKLYRYVYFPAILVSNETPMLNLESFSQISEIQDIDWLDVNIAIQKFSHRIERVSLVLDLYWKSQNKNHALHRLNYL